MSKSVSPWSRRFIEWTAYGNDLDMVTAAKVPRDNWEHWLDGTIPYVPAFLATEETLAVRRARLRQEFERQCEGVQVQHRPHATDLEAIYQGPAFAIYLSQVGAAERERIRRLREDAAWIPWEGSAWKQWAAENPDVIASLEGVADSEGARN